MSENAKANKRIAKNTLIVYGELIFKMALGLYTSRIALEALGVSDFGLYNVVASVVVLFTFISDSLGNTTVRFINVERGKPDGNLNRVFNVCHVLHIAMALFMLLLLEVGGIYYIHHFLNVDPGKEADAMIAFQIAAVVCCMGIINIPFYSLINAAENFLLTSVVGISIKVVQLLMLIWLLHYDGNRVVAFALIESLTTLVSFTVYHFYCYSRWPDIIKWRLFKCWQLYKEILSFSYYNLMRTMAWMARKQGSMLLINFFFGTVANGAYAVARTIERSMSPFANNLKRTASPQITQSYSCGDMERVIFLASRVTKYCMLLMMIAFFPLWAELDFILHIWLVKVPEDALVFSQMILLMVFVAVSDGGNSLVINASGKIGKFMTTYSILTVSCIPIGFLILKAGSPAYMLLVVFIIADIIWRIAQLFLINRILHLPILGYCRESYLPILYTSLPVVLLMVITSQLQLDSTLWHICHLGIVMLLTLISAYYLGLNRSERKTVLDQIAQRIHFHSK